MTKQCDIGLAGLDVMGQNLVLNMESRGYHVAVWNRTTEKMTKFMQQRAGGKNIVGCEAVEELVSQLASPRMIMLMVQAGRPVDAVTLSDEAPISAVLILGIPQTRKPLQGNGQTPPIFQTHYQGVLAKVHRLSTRPFSDEISSSFRKI